MAMGLNQRALMGQLGDEEDEILKPIGGEQTSQDLAPFSVGGLAPTEGRGELEVDGAALPADTLPAAPKANTKLFGTLDQGKLNDPLHAQKSPKYEFLQMMNEGKYGYDQLGDALKALQEKNGARWGGWEADGDKIRNRSGNVAGEFNGLNEFDVIHGFKDPNGPAGWGWQDTSAPQGGGPQFDTPPPMFMGAQGGGGMDGGDVLGGDAMARIQAALQQYQEPSANLKALLEQLQG